MKEAEEESKEWVDDGSLPLDKDGQLMFYFLDAHEDAHLPHTVYLFGKVIFCLRCTASLAALRQITVLTQLKFSIKSDVQRA